jgi:multicomponent Na+:H+ antiporter subunit F
MDVIYVIVAVAIALTMAMAMIRALRGPTIYDRILAVNMFGTVTVMLLSVLSFVVERPDFLDIAMVYALMNFIGTTAVLKYFRYGDLGAGRPEELPGAGGSDPSGAVRNRPSKSQEEAR